MTSLALVQPCAEESVASQIRTFIAQYLKVDAVSVDGRSCLTADFGLDLFEITKLMIMLEQQFCAEEEITDDPNEIECVEDLIHHVEQHRGCFSQLLRDNERSERQISSARC
jgi:acyl carrier protein